MSVVPRKRPNRGQVANDEKGQKATSCSRSWEQRSSIVGSGAFYQSKMLAESFFRDHQFGDIVNVVARARLREPRECQPL